MMVMKYDVLLILILMMFLVGCSQNVAPSDTNLQGTDLQSISSIDDVAQSQATKISQSELAVHNTEDDCWIAYQGNVYDVTDYVPMHPDGAAQIVPLCGTSDEFEDAFTTKHGTSKVSMLEKQGLYKGRLV